MGFNLLIVDDSRIVRSFMSKAIELTGFPVDNIFMAENGRLGLEAIEANKVHLIFLDINMPVMDGMEMIKKMEENGSIKSIPVVIVSTEGSETRIDELKNAGVRDYVRKPFTPESIRDILQRTLGG